MTSTLEDRSFPVFFDKALTKVFGTANERVIKKLLPVVAADQRLGARDGKALR